MAQLVMIKQGLPFRVVVDPASDPPDRGTAVAACTMFGGALAGVVPSDALRFALAAILAVSTVKLWRTPASRPA